MVKRITVATLLGLTLMAPVAAAEDNSAAQAKRPRVQAVGRLVKARIQKGVRAGRLTPAEVSTLRAELKALHTRVQAARQAGGKLTPALRQELRQSLRQIRRDVAAGRTKIKRRK